MWTESRERKQRTNKEIKKITKKGGEVKSEYQTMQVLKTAGSGSR